MGFRSFINENLSGTFWFLILMLTLYRKQDRQNCSKTKKKRINIVIKITQAINNHAKFSDS